MSSCRKRAAIAQFFMVSGFGSEGQAIALAQGLGPATLDAAWPHLTYLAIYRLQVRSQE